MDGHLNIKKSANVESEIESDNVVLSIIYLSVTQSYCKVSLMANKKLTN